MQGEDLSSFVAIAAVLLMPLAIAGLARSRRDSTQTSESFLLNAGRNGIIATIAGAIGGNIGIGSFLAIYLFASQSPVIGFSVAAAYTIGLLLCAFLAPAIRRRAEALGAVGLIDLIQLSHGNHLKIAIWLPVAFVFVLRSAVQIGALGFIVADQIGTALPWTIAALAFLLVLYLLLGGYQAAVETDIAQSTIVVAAVAIALFNMPASTGTPPEFFAFEPYRPVLLVGIWLFLPWSAVLAVDNWQRLTLAQSTRTAQASYLVSACVCGIVFLTIALAGYRSDALSVYTTFETLMPGGIAWLASAMFVACIMSSIDTFVMPLTAGFGRDQSIARTRVMIVILLTLVAGVAIAFGDTLANILTAFNSLVVFLPAAYGALFLRDIPALAPAASMGFGLTSATVFTLIDVNSAAFVGFVVAAGVYGLLARLSSKGSAAGAALAWKNRSR